MSTKGKIQSSKADTPVNSVVFDCTTNMHSQPQLTRKAGTSNA